MSELELDQLIEAMNIPTQDRSDYQEALVRMWQKQNDRLLGGVGHGVRTDNRVD